MKIKILFIVSFLLLEGFEFLVEYLDSKHNGVELPRNVQDVYNKEEYGKWRRYSNECWKTEALEYFITATISLGFLVFNGYAKIFDSFSAYNVYLQYFICILIFTGITMLVSLPFSYYSTFLIEEKYGMNKTSKKTFFFDAVKSLVIGSVLNSVLLFLVMFLFETFGNAAILWGSVAFTLISLLLAVIIMPMMRLFNKFTPLEDGELKDKLLRLCAKYDMEIKKIVVKDASRRTTKANAFCTGFSKRKTISLDDNLVNEYTTDQIVAVFAHEFGHAKYKHVLKSLPFGILNILITFGFLGIFYNTPAFFTSFGFKGVNYYFMMEYLKLISWPVTKLCDMISNYLSRKHEYEADSFAAREGYGEDLIGALKKLVKESLSDINPHPWMIALSYSHPTLSMRIAVIDQVSRENHS